LRRQGREHVGQVFNLRQHGFNEIMLALKRRWRISLKLHLAAQGAFDWRI